MATIADYIELAGLAYTRGSAVGGLPRGFGLGHSEASTWYGNGFQGVAFESDREIIIAFSGTQGGLRSAPISQTGANIRIGVKIVPNMAGSAYKFTKRYVGSAKHLSIVGHSLGGALVQVVGTWLSVPFVSFNGPGMATNMRLSLGNVFHPRQMVRSHRSGVGSGFGGIGLCFNVDGDFVANYGTHIGQVERVACIGTNTHDLSSIRAGLGVLADREPTDFMRRFGLAPVVSEVDVGPAFAVDF